MCAWRECDGHSVLVLVCNNGEHCVTELLTCNINDVSFCDVSFNAGYIILYVLPSHDSPTIKQLKWFEVSQLKKSDCQCCLLFLHTCTYTYMYGYILSLSLCIDSAATHPGHHTGPRGGVASLRLSRRRSLSHSRHLSHSGEGTLCMCAANIR